MAVADHHDIATYYGGREKSFPLLLYLIKLTFCLALCKMIIRRGRVSPAA